MSLWPDVSELADDPDVGGGQNFVVQRRKGKWENARFLLSEPVLMPMVGSIQPATEKQIQALPEGDRASEMISIRCRKQLYTTKASEPRNGDTNEYVSDTVIWHGARFKVVAVKDWRDHGFYRVMLSRMEGS